MSSVLPSWPRLKAVAVAILWSAVGSAIIYKIIYKIVDMIVGLRAEPEEEREGLDLAEHGERAYNY